MKLKLTRLAAVAAAGFISITTASAHTITIGTYNAGAAGSVTVTMGTYTSGHSTLFAQGSISLIAGPSAPVGAIAFGGHTFTKPGLLVDGVNNFFPNGSGDYDSATNGTGQTVSNWQTATFTGLAAGTYTYEISGMTTVNWANWDNGAANWIGTLIIPESSTTAVPDGGDTMALMGLTLLGCAGAWRKLV